MLLSDRYPFLTNYFTKALTSNDRPLPQSILFYGNDLESQYVLAKEIARFLNCQKEKSDSCDCLNCKWIKEGAHPAVVTVSKVDNKPEDDGSSTVISLKQISIIKEALTNSSEFHRVFIFCDRDDEGNIAGLNQINFQAEAANSMLKMIEEPQPGVTFIFLTRYVEDLLSTIVSRSQCFFVPAIDNFDYDYSALNGVFDNYWEMERKNVFDISQKLQDLCKEKSVFQILESMQNYLLSILKTNPNQVAFIKHIELIEEAKRQAKLGIRPINIFDDLCLKLIK